MPSTPQKKPIWETKTRELFDPMCSLVNICTLTVTPLLRSGLGSRALSRGIFTLVFMFWYGAVFQCPYVLLYIPVWLAFVVFRRITPGNVHSQYGGYPHLMCVLPFIKNEYQGRLLEFCVVFGAGLCLLYVSIPLAELVMGAGVALWLMMIIEQATLDSRKRQIRDAEHEAQRWAELQRGESGW